MSKIKTKVPKKIIDPTKDYYKIIPKEFLDEEVTYANQSQINISIPANILVCGFTGSRKTNFLVNFIDTMECFSHFTLYAKKLDEPLYRYLISTWKKVGAEVGESIYEAFDNIEKVIPCDKYKTKDSDGKPINNLVIVDDMINESPKLLKNLKDIFTKGRKNNITVVYISQSYFDTPSLFRKQFQYIAIMKVKNEGDLKRILKDNSFDKTTKELIAMYKYVRTRGDTNFLLLDAKTNRPEFQYRINYTPLISS